MDEFPASPPRAPIPPRWKGIQSLDLVHQLNLRCIDLICGVAINFDGLVPPMISLNRDLWRQLTERSRQLLARVPFIIVDVHFKSALWWRRAASHFPESHGAAIHKNGLPPAENAHLAQETIMFAWQTARWDRVAALVSLGMSPSVTEIVASLTPQSIREIAEREADALLVRWPDDPELWHEMLTAAVAEDQKRLAALQLHAKLLVTGELSKLIAQEGEPGV